MNWRSIFCDHIWKKEKSENLGYSNITTKFPITGHPTKKLVTVYDVNAEQQRCVKCGKRQVVKVEYQNSQGLVDINDGKIK